MSGSAHVTDGGSGGMMSTAGLELPYPRISHQDLLNINFSLYMLLTNHLFRDCTENRMLELQTEEGPFYSTPPPLKSDKNV